MSLPLHQQLAFLAGVFVAVALVCKVGEWLKSRRERKAVRLECLKDPVVIRKLLRR